MDLIYPLSVCIIRIWSNLFAYAYYIRRCFPLFLSGFANFRKATISFILSVRSHGTTLLPHYEFSCVFTIEYFSKICPENSSYINILS